MSSRKNLNSSSLYAGLSGAAVPATAAARNDTIIGRPLVSDVRDAIAAVDAGGGQLLGDGLHLLAQRRRR